MARTSSADRPMASTVARNRSKSASWKAAAINCCSACGVLGSFGAGSSLVAICRSRRLKIPMPCALTSGAERKPSSVAS